MPRGNPSPKLAITVDPEVHEEVLAAARREGVSVSAWMTEAARQALRRRAGLAAVALWKNNTGHSPQPKWMTPAGASGHNSALHPRRVVLHE